jgi:hypothetical protein
MGCCRPGPAGTANVMADVVTGQLQAISGVGATGIAQASSVTTQGLG